MKLATISALLLVCFSLPAAALPPNCKWPEDYNPVTGKCRDRLMHSDETRQSAVTADEAEPKIPEGREGDVQ